MLLGKREDGVRRLPFDLQKQFDEGYVSNFFGRGSFELKVTHQGRKHLEESEHSRAVTEPREKTVSAQKSAEVQNRDQASSERNARERRDSTNGRCCAQPSSTDFENYPNMRVPTLTTPSVATGSLGTHPVSPPVPLKR